METKEKLQQAYINYVLLNGEQPKSVFLFAKENDLAEEEFYNYFGSFDNIEQNIWGEMMEKTISEVKTQEVWTQYSSREKALSLLFAFFEFMKSRRSFASFSIKMNRLNTSKVLGDLKNRFEAFSDEILKEGIESNELANRSFFAKRYKNALWIQFAFLLDFWLKDTSAGFERTDEAIEKGINVTFDLFQWSPIDNLFEYGKFLAKNSMIKVPF